MSDSEAPIDCSPPGSSIHGISWAGILEWVAVSFFRRTSPPRDQNCVSCLLHWQADSLPAEPPVTMFILILFNHKIRNLFRILCDWSHSIDEDTKAQSGCWLRLYIKQKNEPSSWARSICAIHACHLISSIRHCLECYRLTSSDIFLWKFYPVFSALISNLVYSYSFSEKE